MGDTKEILTNRYTHSTFLSSSYK